MYQSTEYKESRKQNKSDRLKADDITSDKSRGSRLATGDSLWYIPSINSGITDLYRVGTQITRSSQYTINTNIKEGKYLFGRLEYLLYYIIWKHLTRCNEI